MTEAEAKSRAERISSLFFQPKTDLNKQLTLLIAHELWRIDNEWEYKMKLKNTGIVLPEGHINSNEPD